MAGDRANSWLTYATRYRWSSSTGRVEPAERAADQALDTAVQRIHASNVSESTELDYGYIQSCHGVSTKQSYIMAHTSVTKQRHAAHNCTTHYTDFNTLLAEFHLHINQTRARR